MKLLLMVALFTGLATNTYAQGAATTSKVEADKAALQLAISALTGDHADLNRLEDDASSNISSAQYGLAEFYARDIGSAYATIDEVYHYLEERDPSLKQVEENIERIEHNDRKKINDRQLNAKIRSLLDSAIKSGDPAAENMLGKDLFFNPWRYSALVKASTGLPPDAAGWPTAATTLSLAWGFHPPPPELLAAGCVFREDQHKADVYLIRGATLGDPAAMMALVEKYQEEGDPAAMRTWLARLDSAVAKGIPDAANARAALQNVQ